VYMSLSTAVPLNRSLDWRTTNQVTNFSLAFSCRMAPFLTIMILVIIIPKVVCMVLMLMLILHPGVIGRGHYSVVEDVYNKRVAVVKYCNEE